MDPDIVIPILITLGGAVVVLLGTSIAFGVAWIRARDRARRAERDLGEGSRGSAAGLERLERAVDVIAIEVERIAEAERFRTQLLARGEAKERLPAAPGRIVTPH